MIRYFFICLFFFSSSAFSSSRLGTGGKATSYNDHFDMLSTQQRAQLAQKYAAERCVNKTGMQVSCGFRSEWTNGDKSFNWDPYMNTIPQGTKVEVDIKCDEAQGKFYVNVQVPVKTCNRRTGRCQITNKYFANPYDGDGDNRVLRDQPTRWLASPGLYPDNRSDAPGGFPRRTEGGSAVVTEYHVVSKNQSWAGAQMLYALWIRGGYAVHGSNSVDGYPGSGGCLRLKQLDAFALYNLARRVGPNNMNYNWYGYGRTNPRTGKPYCAGPPGHREQILMARNQITQEQRAESLRILDEGLQRQMKAEGRREVASTIEESDPQRSVNSVPKKKNK